MFYNDQRVVLLAEKGFKVKKAKIELDRFTTAQKINDAEGINSPMHNRERLESDNSDQSINSFNVESSSKRFSAPWSKWMSDLSSRWAGRLQGVDHLQGILRATYSADTENSPVTLKVKPSWPEWLVDVSYDVMKRSTYGKLQRRKLKLTQYHILNVKNGIEITKSFKYADVCDLYLRDQNSFVLSLNVKDASSQESIKTISYYTSLAVHIVQVRPLSFISLSFSFFLIVKGPYCRTHTYVDT